MTNTYPSWLHTPTDTFHNYHIRTTSNTLIHTHVTTHTPVDIHLQQLYMVMAIDTLHNYHIRTTCGHTLALQARGGLESESCIKLLIRERIGGSLVSFNHVQVSFWLPTFQPPFLAGCFVRSEEGFDIMENLSCAYCTVHSACTSMQSIANLGNFH